MKNRNLDHHDQWATPMEFYNELDVEFHFDFDPCPLWDGPVPREMDGLIIPWGMRNFVNPPYSRKLKEAFVHRALEESLLGKLSVLLLPVSTSTVLFHEVILPHAREIRFVRGRIAFEGVGVRSSGRKGMHDSMVVVFEAR